MRTSVPAKYEHGQIILAEVPANIQSSDVLFTFLVSERNHSPKGKRGGYGIYKGQTEGPKDFNAPMDEFEEYM